ncbi:hypothetical protein QN277_013023 [Acacia crassicarpa]|uniref:Thaumatin-like protein n=1 Tax=Acacia crassicarpa TaxID=499986 RepID=A0AAE1N2V1_9FABA|nr:hypothetical protein QN277_013023 [Acacia crassicarpa]
MAVRALFKFLLPLLLLFPGGRCDVKFHFTNQCPYTVWRAASTDMVDAEPDLPPDVQTTYSMDDRWTGSIWVRTQCSNNASFYFSCQTGDCGTGKKICAGPQPSNPVTLLNFDINNPVVSYEVSLIHGQNMRVRIQPNGGTLVDGSGPCPVVDCAIDLKDVCPPSLVAANREGRYAGCYSACDVLREPKYCCSNSSCQPDEYSKKNKELCPMAHTYPGDSNPPKYKCKGADSYDVTFCPV